MSKNKKNRNKHNNVEYQEKDHSKYYLFIIKAGIIACLFLPLLIVHSHMYSMQVGKVLVFRTIIEIIAFFYMILIAKKEEYRPKWGIFELSITLFLFLYLITSFTGANFLRSFWGTAERMGGFFTMLHFWAYFVILVSVFKTKREWKLLFGVSILVSLISSLYAFVQSALFWRTILPWIELKNAGIYNEITRFVTEKNFVTIDNVRPFGTIGNAGLFTAYILYNMFFGIYLLLGKTDIVQISPLIVRGINSENRELLDSPPKADHSKNNCQKLNLLGIGRLVLMKIVYCITVAFTIFVLVIAGSRSSFLAVIGGLFILGLVYIILSGKRKVQGLSITLVLILFLGSAYIFLNKNEEWVKGNYMLERLVSISLGADDQRMMTWESSWRGYLDYPILGVGPENYNIVFNKYFNPLHFLGFGYVTWYDKAHNIFLDILTTMGVVGFASYLGIFGIIYWFLVKNRHKARENLTAFALITSLPVAYFIQNMFWFDDFSTYLMLFLFFAFVSNFINEELKFEYNVEKGRKMMNSINRILNLGNIEYRILENRKIVIATAGIILALAAYYTNVKAWRFHDLTTIAVGAFSLNADDSFLWYREAMKNSTYLGRQELYKRFGNYVNTKYALLGDEDQKERDAFKQNMKFAISEMENAVSENKEDVQFYSILGALYNKYYNNFRDAEYIEKAEKTLRKAVELSPERETVYYEYGQTMVFKKDYKKAIELFKKGVDLNPPVPVSHWYLGMAYLNAREYQSADAEISEAIRLGYGYKTIKDILNIVPIYIELKDYRRLEKLYSDVLDLDPDNPKIYVSLALVYKELGDKASAKSMAKKAIAVDETYRIEGERFIYELESGK